MLMVYPIRWKVKKRRNCVNGLIGGKRRSLSLLMLLAPRKAVRLRSQQTRWTSHGFWSLAFDLSSDAELFD